MTEQELFTKMEQSIKLHGAKARISFESATNIAKAYAAAKDAEIGRLTFQLSEANRVLEAHKVVAASRSENIAALQADKERLREGIQKGLIEQGGVFLNSELLALLSPADGDGVEEKVPQSLWRLADKIIESQKKLALMSDEEKKSIGWNLLHELWTDEIEDAWNARVGRGIEA